MTEKNNFISRTLLNEEKIWKEFNRLSLKIKKKTKKEKPQFETNAKEIETKSKQFYDIKKFKKSKIIKFLRSFFSKRRTKQFRKSFSLKIKTSSFTFEHKESEKQKYKRIQTSDSEHLFEKKSLDIKKIETSTKKSSIQSISATMKNTSIESI